MEQSNPPLRASNIADIKAKVAEMVGQGGGTTSATPGGYAYVLYQGDSSTNSITLSDSAFNYDKLVIEGYYMAMGSAAMDIAITAEWPKNKDKRKFQITTNDLTTGDTPALTVNTDVWEVSEDGLDLDLVLALQGIDTDNITVIPESTSQITITKVIGFNNISSGPANKPSYDVPYFDGGDYGVVAYLDRDNNVAYYTATSANDLQLAAPNSGASYYTIKTLANGENITNNNIVAFSWGSQITSIPNYTLLRCRLLQSVYGLESSAVTTIGSGFLRECASFNQPLALPDTVTTIGDNFLTSAYSFNSALTLPSALTSISGNFLTFCYTYNQPLVLPQSLKSIGASFLASCYSFNQPLSLPIGLQSIGLSFLASCYSFNQPIIIPDTVNLISSSTSSSLGFMTECRAFNQPVTLSAAMTSIPSYFMSSCPSFNNSITLPTSLTTIGSGFLRGCTSFNQPLALPDTVTTIGDNFLQGCSSFLQPLTIPATVRTISVSYFMNNCYSFIGPLTINSPASISADTFALATALSTAPMYTTGVTLQGLNASLWKSTLDDRTSSPFRKLTIAEETTE